LVLLAVTQVTHKSVWDLAQVHCRYTVEVYQYVRVPFALMICVQESRPIFETMQARSCEIWPRTPVRVSYAFLRPTASPTTNALPFLSPLYLFCAFFLAEILTHFSPLIPSALVGLSFLSLVFGAEAHYLPEF